MSKKIKIAVIDGKGGGIEKWNVALTNSNNLSLKDNIDNAAKIIKEYIE